VVIAARVQGRGGAGLGGGTGRVPAGGWAGFHGFTGQWLLVQGG
jgi:hypothetical protein